RRPLRWWRGRGARPPGGRRCRCGGGCRSWRAPGFGEERQPFGCLYDAQPNGCLSTPVSRPAAEAAVEPLDQLPPCDRAVPGLEEWRRPGPAGVGGVERDRQPAGVAVVGRRAEPRVVAQRGALERVGHQVERRAEAGPPRPRRRIAAVDDGEPPASDAEEGS